MRKINPAYMEAVVREVSKCPYFMLISMEVKALGWGESRIEVVVQQKHLQPFGMVHGGVFSSLIDAAAFWAVYSQVDEGVGMTTVEMKLNYLAPASKGRMIARGKSLKVGKTIALGETFIEDEEGKLLAYGTATMMTLKDLEFQGVKFPSKFVD